MSNIDSGAVDQIGLVAGDEAVGAVEIKDGDTDTRLDVELDSTKNAAFVQSESLATSAKQDNMIDRLGEVQASPTANTVLDRLKALLTELQEKADLSETQPVKQTALPLATNVSSTLTLTSASTAYQITEPTSAFLVTYCNDSDTDMFWGFATLTSGGIKLESGGGTLTLLCEANSSPFFYCASAGKVLNYTTTVL